MSKFQPKTYRSKVTVAKHVQRLPVVQQLSATQQSLVKIQPSWNEWLAQHLPRCSPRHATISNINAGEVSIACDNAAIASQINHQQQSVIDHFAKLAIKNVTSVHVFVNQWAQDSSISGTTRSADTTSTTQQLKDSRTSPDQSKTPPNSNALDSLELCQKNVKNEILANALERLRESLKNL